MTARRIGLVFIPTFITLFITVPHIVAQTSKPIEQETDFAHDIRVGVEETKNSSVASSQQTHILDSEIVNGRISTVLGALDIDVIQSMDEDVLNREVKTKEEEEDVPDIKIQDISPTSSMKY